jgi:hypothetical protein
MWSDPSPRFPVGFSVILGSVANPFVVAPRIRRPAGRGSRKVHPFPSRSGRVGLRWLERTILPHLGTYLCRSWAGPSMGLPLANQFSALEASIEEPVYLFAPAFRPVFFCWHERLNRLTQRSHWHSKQKAPPKRGGVATNAESTSTKGRGPIRSAGSRSDVCHADRGAGCATVLRQGYQGS